MDVAIFSPYGCSSEETGVLGLIGNYLRNMLPEVGLLRCNGLFSLCDRDAEISWRRGIQTCFNCMLEQERVANWAGIKLQQLSTYISPEEILATKRWITSIPTAELAAAEYKNINVFELCRESFRARLSLDLPDPKNLQHEHICRRLMVSAARTMVAVDHFLEEQSPSLSLLAGQGDFISNTYAVCCRASDRRVACFQWDLGSRSVRITHPREDKHYSCPLVFEDITTMRGDSRTWPWELVQIVEDILVFLDISTSQLSLPIAH